MAAYAIDIRPRARRSVRRLDPLARKAVAEVIDSLAIDPRPPGVRALSGHRPYPRVRSGDYRVIYFVDNRARVVTVAAVGHRREVTARLISSATPPGWTWLACRSHAQRAIAAPTGR